MNKITRKRLNRANTENAIVLKQVNIDLDKIAASFTSDIETLLELSYTPSGVPNKKRPGLDYYDKRRDRHTDDSLVSYQGTYGLYEDNNN
jgi:hypothetical protein